jgi:hypothetical protein
LTPAEIAAHSPIRRLVVQKPIAIAYGARELPELRRQSRVFHRHRAEAQAPGALIPVRVAANVVVMDGAVVGWMGHIERSEP